MSNTNRNGKSPYAQTRPSIEPDPGLFEPLRIKSSLLMTPGPCNISERVSAATVLPMLAHTDPQVLKVYKDISAGIRYVFQTRNHYSLAITGSATCAMETAVCNLLEKGDTFLVANHVYWSERVARMGTGHGCNVVKIDVPKIGDIFEIKQFENLLDTHRPKMMFTVHGDSTTGILQPLDGLGKLCHKYNCLLLVDAVMSLCNAPLNTDELEIDVVFSASQKALSGPPGLSIISLSPRAMEVIDNRKTEIDSFYMNIKLLSAAWGIAKKDAYPYHYTPAVSLLYGLREALAMVADEGIDNVIERHLKNSAMVQSELQKIGVKFLVDPKHRLYSLLAIEIPENIDGMAVKDYLYNHYNITIFGGLGPTVGKIWRIGILGINANKNCTTLLCTAFKEAFENAKKQSQL